MKKQYIAPSVEIEMYSVSAFCSGCSVTITDFTLNTYSNMACLEQYIKDFVEDAEDCFNQPFDISVTES